MKHFISFIFTMFMFSQLVAAKSGDEMRFLPVQDAGRIKPFDTFAKETLELIYGKQTYRESEGKPAVEAQWVVLTWMLAPESWVKRPLFEVKYHELLAQLGLPKEQKHFSGNDIFDSQKFANLMQDLQNKRESKEKLTPYYQALQRLENQFILFREMASGRMLKIYPVPTSDTWLAVAELPPEAQSAFLEISKAVANYLGALTEGTSSEDTRTQLAGELDKAVLGFEATAQKSDPAKYALSHKVKTEVLYNDLHPFRIAYFFYLMSALVLLFLWIRNAPKGMAVAWILLLIGFAIHTAGFVFRVYLAERPPVSNMYETVIWASWGTVMFSIVLELFYKFRVMLLAGSLMGLFALVIADSAPAILDPSLQPLEAVLRSNYWLIVHVMTISISYAAFLLAFGLGDLGIIYYVIDANKHAEKIQKITTGVYRAMQIGVAFLAPGIILGGIWADYSWGRFWGWDPKETWALIVLLGYIVVLHSF